MAVYHVVCLLLAAEEKILNLLLSHVVLILFLVK